MASEELLDQIADAPTLDEVIRLVADLPDPSMALVPLVDKGKIPYLQYLLEHGADINYVNPTSEQHTPLTQAASNEDELLINFILSHGADPNLQDSCGYYPLNYVVESPFLTRLLLSKEADPDTGLHYAITSARRTSEERLEVVTLLLEAGAHPDFPFDDGNTVLMRACMLRRVDFIELLLPYSEVNLQNLYTGQTALHIAIAYNVVEAIDLLAPLTDLELVDNEDATPLRLAIDYGNLYAVEVLLANGADPWAMDEHDESYVYYAIRVESEPIVEALLRQRQEDIENGVVPPDQEIVSDKDSDRAWGKILILLLRYQ
jgi:ankyrin repeat protein